MNDFIHVPIALAIMLIGMGLAALGVPLVVLCAIGGFAVIVMREVTQEEYRYIEAHGGLRANMPWYGGLRFWLWNQHSLMETLWGTLAVALLAAADLLAAK